MRKSVLLLASTLAAVAAAHAQTPKPPTGTGDPSAASTPHQRSATGAKSAESSPAGSPEAAAASTPHQQAATGAKGGEAKLKMAHADGMVPATFTKKAAMDGMTEVELGKIALAKSQDSKIRKFAERMVADHSKANDQLAAIAKSKNIEVPKSLDSEHQAMIQSLNSKSGAAFDAAYSEHMAMAHAQALALFDGASMSADADLAGFAKKTVPTLKEHKKMADALPGVRTAEASGDGSHKE